MIANTDLQSQADRAVFVLDEIEELVVNHDTDLRVLWANRAACESSGLQLEDLVGRFCYQVWHSRKEPCPGCPLVATIRSRKPETAELTTDGRTRIIKSYPITDSDGELISVVGVTMDVSNLRRVEMSKQESEATYRQLVEQSLQGIIVVQDMKILFANPALSRMTGYTVEELLNLDPEGVRNLVHPDDQDLVWGRYETRLRGRGVPERYYFRGVRKDGTVWNAEIYASVVTLDGKPAVQAVLLDITESVRAQEALRRSEEKYRSLVENLNEIIFTLDPDGAFTYVSPVVKQLLGYDPAEIIGKRFNWFVHPDDAPSLLVAFERCDRDHSSPRELRMLATDGSIHYMRISCTPYYDAGEFRGITGVMADVTETRQANEIVRERQQMYETLLKTTTDAIAIIDLEGNFIEASERTARLFGVKSAEDLVGKNAFSFVLPAHHRKALTSFKEALKTGYIRGKTFTMSRADSSHFSAQIDAALIHDAKGKPKSFILTIRDITEAKRVERQLRKSQQRFDHIASLVKEWIWEIDQSCVLTYSNGAVKAALGYEPDEILGTYMHDHFSLTDDPESKRGLLELIQAQETFHDFEVTFRNKQGDPVRLSLSGIPIVDEDRRLAGYRGTASPSRHHSSAQMDGTLRKLLALNEAVILTDLDGHVLFLNRKAETLTGFSQEEAGRRKSDDVLSLYRLDGNASQIRFEDLKPQVQDARVEGRANLKQRDGKMVQVAFSSAIATDASGSQSGILVIFKPVGE